MKCERLKEKEEGRVGKEKKSREHPAEDGKEGKGEGKISGAENNRAEAQEKNAKRQRTE